MEKEGVVYTWGGTLCSPRKEDNPTVVTWRDLEDVVPAEISQAPEDKYGSISLTGGIYNSPTHSNREQSGC